MTKPKLYENIKLLLADPDQHFPEGFDPQNPFDVKHLEKASREGFIDKVKLENGTAVVALQKFDPKALKEVSPLDVELCDGATYIVVPRSDKSYEKRVSSFCRSSFVFFDSFSKSHH